MIVIAIILLAAAQAADYFYQADLHGWVNPLWKNGRRWKTDNPDKTWPEWLDWLPHDGWHWAQVVRNFGDAVGVALAVLWLSGQSWPLLYTLGETGHTLICLALSLAIRAALRGLFFGGMYRYLRSRPELGK